MNQIDQIKDILFSNEKRALDALTRRIEKRESRVADMADVLPESIGRSHADGDRLNKALRIPVEECLKDSISRDPQTFANALFPVIGPAIRKSISESLKSFNESVTRAIEEKASLKSFKWKMQAKKAGIPYAQFLIQKNLEYRVDHAYLIQPDTGLLISDAHRPDAVRKDDDAVSAMLTAIQDFVKESFSDENEGTLETADIGKYTLWTMQGPHAMLACVINGVPPRGLREHFTEVLERIHLQFSEVLDAFDGTPTDKLKAIEPQLEDCLLQQAKEGEEQIQKKKGVGPLGFIFFLALCALAWFAYQSFQFHRAGNGLLETLETAPGILVTSSDYNGGKLHVKGLRDTNAIDENNLVTTKGLDAEKVVFDFKPFYSLEKEIQEKRIKQEIDIPKDITMLVSNNGEVKFDGEITSQFKLDAETKLKGMLGVESISFGKVHYTDEALLSAVIAATQPPEGVNASVTDGVLTLQGSAPYAWHQTLETSMTSVTGIEKTEKAELVISEVADIEAIQADINNATIMFVWRTRLLEGEETQLASLAEKLKIYGSKLEQLNIEPEIILTGYTDKTGSQEQNIDLLLERALYIKGRMVGMGLRSSWIFVRSGQMSGEQGVVDATQRKVELSIDADLASFK